MSTPSMQDGAAVGVVGADQQVHQRGLARAGGADDGQRAAGLDLEARSSCSTQPRSRAPG